MPNDEPKSLSYEVLEGKLEDANKEIASLKAEIADMKQVIKHNLSAKLDEQGDPAENGKLTKEKFEERLKEDLGLC